MSGGSRRPRGARRPQRRGARGAHGSRIARRRCTSRRRRRGGLCDGARRPRAPPIESWSSAPFTPWGRRSIGSRRGASCRAGRFANILGRRELMNTAGPMMDRRVKERLIGATILVALIVLIVPELLSGPKRPRVAAARRRLAQLPRATCRSISRPKGNGRRPSRRGRRRRRRPMRRVRRRTLPRRVRPAPARRLRRRRPRMRRSRLPRVRPASRRSEPRTALDRRLKRRHRPPNRQRRRPARRRPCLVR